MIILDQQMVQLNHLQVQGTYETYKQTNDASKTKADIQLNHCLRKEKKKRDKPIISSTVVHLAHKLMHKLCGILCMYLEADQDQMCSGYEVGV